MAYDEALAARIRDVLPLTDRIAEQHMFGGVVYLLDGKMLCGVVKSDLMVRVGKDAYPAALRRPHARPMDFTGRPLTGFVFVAPSGLRRRAALSAWVRQAHDYVAALPPPKRPQRARARPPRTARSR